MSVNIITQPAANSVVAAYRPIRFLLDANQLPTGSGPAVVVMADVYLDGVYYSSVSVTDYSPLVIFLFSFYFFEIDIQDKIQEYLTSKFARMYEATNGDMEDKTMLENFSCSVQVKFREGYVDTNGFTQMYATAPVQGTKFTAPVAGTGTATSNTFYALNATLTHEDNPNLGLHLDSFKDPFQATYPLSHRPNFMPSIGKRIGNGKYFVCKEDRDFMFWFSNAYDSTTWYVSVSGKYANGTTFTTTAKAYPTPTTTPATYRVYSFDAGIPNLRNMFATPAWDDVVEYEVFVFAFMFQAARQYYYVKRNGCCSERVRIFFLNNLGTFDAINFEAISEVNKTTSDLFQYGQPGAFASYLKTQPGLSRLQPKQNDFYEAQTVDYYEKDMSWIKELLGTPRAYIQWTGTQGQTSSLVPIKIEDTELQTLKVNDRYEYNVKIKYSLSNERINIRN